MNSPNHAPRAWPGEALVAPGQTLESVTRTISDIPLLHPFPRFWWTVFGLALVFVMVLLTAIAWVFTRGIGIWGVNEPVAWGFAIGNFVWWIGIGNAGTFISASLLLMHQPWRTSINRLAEAMTLFAVACAALFTLIHLGRPEFVYWLVPYPGTTGLWPQFRSPLDWDLFAVSTYGVVSLMFWYVGLLPDLATMRDRSATQFKARLYGLLCLGWRGDARHWVHHQKLYILLAGLAAPLVIVVHSVVGFDFAVAILPGWHSTIFPPYFVAGALFSGMSMVLTLIIPLRAVYQLQGLITARHLDLMAKVLMATGWIMIYSYFSEGFNAWRSGNIFDRYTDVSRTIGSYAGYFWAVMAFNVIAPQLLWVRRWRNNPIVLFVVALFVNIGMWIERFVIVVTSLHRDFLPSSWGMYHATFWDYSTLFGSVGLFVTLFFLFLRYVPAISMTEVRRLVAGKGDDR
jgi:Ni/Fe-hydrogenase subunit HybB-like protein